ncbi:peptidylprolyl isomerase [Neobacillus sp. D3-1R]|uniref:peptidylprolyl isomerase n=1 Tax=Neobacillus sp. D3-1R TaxID=3445778 RepID=UPI003FA0F94A
MKLKLITVIIAVLLTLTACGTNSEKENASKNEKKSNTEQTTEKKEGEQAAAVDGYPQLTTEVQENERLVEMNTSMGSIKIKLFPEMAPKAVENFIKHSEEGYFDGLIFHRVIKDFMIQGGDPQGTGMGGESIYGQPFEDEFSDKLFNLRGALSMANSGPNTNGSQFFIVQNTKLGEGMTDQMKQAKYPEDIIKAYDENGGTPWLDFRHTIFGQVVEGMDIVDSIANVETVENDKPAKDVVIKSVKVLK